LNNTFQFEITCRQVWRELSNYCDDDLTLELKGRIEQHLSVCNHCRALMDGMRNLVTIIVDDRALDLPDEVRRRLYSRWADHLNK
jgi:predicted anti-sigma-YlaC factor YlaD